MVNYADYIPDPNSAGYQAYKQLSDFVNTMGADYENFVAAALNDHRTLQQNVMRLFLQLVEGWAQMYDEGFYDERNEATCRLAKKIHELVQAEGMTLPLI